MPAAFLLVVLAAPPIFGAKNYPLANGIDARIFGPDEVFSDLIEADGDGRLYFILPTGERYELVTGIEDPIIANKGDGSFHPMREGVVLAAVAEIDLRGRSIGLEVEIFILPLPRYYAMASSTAGNRIILSPGVYEVGEAVTAFTVTHEIGHCYHNAYLPGNDQEGWRAYLSTRQIEGDPTFDPSSLHMNRPEEIFAEDFRYLFGGENANYTGTIENPNLPSPDLVHGLMEFMIELASGPYVSPAVPAGTVILAASNHPNPFNPMTTITARLAGTVGRPVTVDVYDVSGALVRRLHHGNVTDGWLSLTWDGTGGDGKACGSGVYFYRIGAGGEAVTGKMLLVR